MFEILQRTTVLQMKCDCGDEFEEETEILDSEESIFIECPACGKSCNVEVKIAIEE